MQHQMVTLAPGMVPVAPLLRILGAIERPALETFIETGIALLDAYDGDPDNEPSGDEGDTSNAEDEQFAGVAHHSGSAGCEISDPDHEHDGLEPQHD